MVGGVVRQVPMSMRPAVICVLLSVALAGCVQGDPKPGPAVAPGAQAVPTASSTFEATFSGGAGDWLFLYVPYVNATTELEGETSWVVSTAPAGGAHHVAWFGPAWVWDDRGRAEVFAFGDSGARVVSEGVYTDADEWGWGLSAGDPPLGRNLAFGADAPWTLEVALEITSGADGYGLPVVIEGSGANASVHRQDFVPGPIAPASQYAASGSFERPGWQIVQFLEDPVQPVGLRDYRLEIPGDVVERTGYRYGVQGPAGYASSNNIFAGLMRFAGSPGDWSVGATYAEAKYDLPAIVFDLPGGSGWPQWAEHSVTWFASPFHDGVTPPLPPVQDLWVDAG